jgi:hypothetical protein
MSAKPGLPNPDFIGFLRKYIKPGMESRCLFCKEVMSVEGYHDGERGRIFLKCDCSEYTMMEQEYTLLTLDETE